MIKLWSPRRGFPLREMYCFCRSFSDSVACDKDSIVKEASKRVERDKITKDHLDDSQRKMIAVDKHEELKVLSPAPSEYFQDRIGIIQQQVKNPMQQGTANTHSFQLSFDTKERWENPLMGWSSSGDSHSNLSLDFPSPAEAVRYAENQGYKWDYEHQVEEEKPLKPKSYANNFTWKSRTRVSTK